jgi:predicted aldo/keto reductase-like oxidoreductase
MSGHVAPVAIQAIESGAIEVLMFPINLVEHDDVEKRAVRQACMEHEVGLVAMKAYHGGTLLFANGQPSGITPAQCLAYVLALPVATTVPGPKDVDEWKATLHYLQATDDEKEYKSVAAGLHEHLAGQCVYCQHCLPCPEELQIGWLIWLVDYARSGVTDTLMDWYAGHQVKASACIECGECLARCPFGVDIMAKLRTAVEILEEKAA